MLKEIQLHRHGFVLVMLFLLAFMLRAYRIDHYGIWTDEKFSVHEANSFPVIDLPAHQTFTKHDLQKYNTVPGVVASCIKADNGNGLAYIITLHFWCKAFSNTDLSIRMLSLLMGLLVIAAGYLLVREISDNPDCALAACLLLALSPVLIDLSREARAYMMAVFFSLTSSILFFKIINGQLVRFYYFLLYALIVTASILSHYLTAYIIAAQIVIVILSGLPAVKWKGFIFSGIIVCTLSVAWLLNGGLEGLQGISAMNSKYIQLMHQDPGNSLYMKATTGAITKGWIQNMLSVTGNSLQMTGLQLRHLFLLLLVPAGIFYFGLKKNQSLRHGKNLVPLVILASSGFFYATILALNAGHIISFLTHFSSFSAPYALIIMSLAIAALNHIPTIQKRILFTLAALQILIMTASIGAIYAGSADWTTGKNEFIAAAEKINTAVESSDGIYRILYKSRQEALNTNLYLGEYTSSVLQAVNPGIDARIILISIHNNVRTTQIIR